MRNFLCIMVALLMVSSGSMVLASPNASAESVEMIIPVDDWFSIPFELEDLGVFTFSVQVESGPVVDVFLMDQENYTLYIQGLDFYVMEDASADGVSSFAAGWSEQGSWVLVVDNTDAGGTQVGQGTGGATVRIDYELVGSDTIQSIVDWMFIIIGLVVVIIIVIIVVVVLMKRKKTPPSIVPPPPRQPSMPATRYCQNCGTALLPDASFCPKCGSKQG